MKKMTKALSLILSLAMAISMLTGVSALAAEELRVVDWNADSDFITLDFSHAVDVASLNEGLTLYLNGDRVAATAAVTMYNQSALGKNQAFDFDFNTYVITVDGAKIATGEENVYTLELKNVAAAAVEVEEGQEPVVIAPLDSYTKSFYVDVLDTDMSIPEGNLVALRNFGTEYDYAWGVFGYGAEFMRYDVTDESFKLIDHLKFRYDKNGDGTAETLIGTTKLTKFTMPLNTCSTAGYDEEKFAENYKGSRIAYFYELQKDEETGKYVTEPLYEEEPSFAVVSTCNYTYKASDGSFSASAYNMGLYEISENENVSEENPAPYVVGKLLAENIKDNTGATAAAQSNFSKLFKKENGKYELLKLTNYTFKLKDNINFDNALPQDDISINKNVNGSWVFSLFLNAQDSQSGNSPNLLGAGNNAGLPNFGISVDIGQYYKNNSNGTLKLSISDGEGETKGVQFRAPSGYKDRNYIEAELKFANKNGRMIGYFNGQKVLDLTRTAELAAGFPAVKAGHTRHGANLKDGYHDMGFVETLSGCIITTAVEVEKVVASDFAFDKAAGTATVIAKNLSAAEKSVLAICAIYDENGALLSAYKVANVTLAKDGGKEEIVIENIDATIENAAQARVFIWDAATLESYADLVAVLAEAE